MGRGGGGKRAKSSGRKSGPGGAGGSAELPLADFAQKVLEAARASTTGKFGDNKVFISHVHKAFPDMSLDAFKNRLTEANNKRHLNLNRADMVEAMNPKDVASSEATHFGAEYHFVRTDQIPGK